MTANSSQITSDSARERSLPNVKWKYAFEIGLAPFLSNGLLRIGNAVRTVGSGRVVMPAGWPGSTPT